MAYWYISIRRVAEVRGPESKEPVRVPLGFYGGVFIEADGEEIDAVGAAQERFDFIPRDCQCQVWRLSEMPPLAYRDRLLSEADLMALDEHERMETN